MCGGPAWVRRLSEICLPFYISARTGTVDQLIVATGNIASEESNQL